MNWAILITVAASVVGTLVTLRKAWIAERHAAKTASQMEGNGQGTVPDMLERLLDLALDHDHRLTRVEEKVETLSNRRRWF